MTYVGVRDGARVWNGTGAARARILRHRTAQGGSDGWAAAALARPPGGG